MTLLRLCLLPAILASCAALGAQTATAVDEASATPATVAVTPYNAHQSLSLALQHLEDAEKDVRRFTYILDITMANVGRAGRTRDLTTRKYETTYINNLPYMRLLEQDGAPLTGSALKDEQKRYDKAVKKKKELGAEKRAETDDFTVIQPEFSLATVLDSSYTLNVVASGLSNNEPTHVIDAIPIPTVKRMTSCLWRVRFWIADQTNNVRRYVEDTTGDDRPQCSHIGMDLKYIEVDGIPKLSSQASRFKLPDGRGGYETSKSLATYSNYRRFGATITIKNGDVIPPEEPAKP